MLTKSKHRQLLVSLKKYNKQYLKKPINDLDESGTRLMINSFLTEVLGFAPIEEVKTEYMIRGTYADYVIQLKGVRHFLVEVKSLSFELSDKHLRQATNYGANEGIEWVLLTNGKNFDFYKILFNKPIEAIKVFSTDISETSSFKVAAEFLQYLTKTSVANKGLEILWKRCLALDPTTIARFLYDRPVLNFLKRTLKKKYKNKFTDQEICNTINRIITEPIQLDDMKPARIRKKRKKKDLPTLATNENSKIISETERSNKGITSN